ncbi:---NA--- [Paramuricea clavata]|uniref:---NA n=1 Tax=Paramuricea clavata TaxID=317549 RepID=A0A6S7IHQ2_PARCT|nr:---NA--- [Paramuricea clavata]
MKAIYTLPVYLFLLVIYRTKAHDISKRATANNDLYVLAERDGGCVSVDSIEPCPVTWKLSAIAAKFYNQQTRLTNLSLNELGVLSASDECKDAFKTTMCGQAAPKCSADGSQDYNAYGDVATACAKIYSECPKNVSEQFKSHRLCDKVFSGKIAKPTCVTPPKIEGSCPQPKYKVCE